MTYQSCKFYSRCCKSLCQSKHLIDQSCPRPLKLNLHSLLNKKNFLLCAKLNFQNVTQTRTRKSCDSRPRPIHPHLVSIHGESVRPDILILVVIGMTREIPEGEEIDHLLIASEMTDLGLDMNIDEGMIIRTEEVIASLFM